jgi:peptidoglycan/xylan/chitin deacetylase (PgdA/CDA1 family)
MVLGKAFSKKAMDHISRYLSISANPNPINISKSSQAGSTTISWEVPSNTEVEIHIDAPDGPLFCKARGSGSAITGRWVHDGMIFYLQDVSDSKPLISDNTLATVTVSIIKKKTIEWLRLPLIWIIKKIESTGLVLMYHRISEKLPDPWRLNVIPEHFAEHLQVLKKIGVPMQLQQVATLIEKKGRPPKQWFAITIDDGYDDNLKKANPILEYYDFPSTIFLTASTIDEKKEFWWDELERILLQPGILPKHLLLNILGKEYKWDLGEWAEYEQADFHKNLNWYVSSNNSPSTRHQLYTSLHKLINPLPKGHRQEILSYLNNWSGGLTNSQPIFMPLNSDEIIQLSKSKLIDIGSHTMNHTNLSRVSFEIQKNEIEGSKKKIESLIGKRIFSLSYPHGAYGTETINIVKNAGYICSCTNTEGIISKSTNRFLLPRIHIVDCNGEVFEKNLWNYLKSLDIIRN